MNKSMFNSIDEFKDARKYWVDKLSGELENTVFQYDFKKVETDKKAVFSLSLEKELSDKMISMSKGQDLLLYILLTAALKVLIYKYTNQDNVVISSPIYNVSGENTDSPTCILLKDSIDSKMTYKEFLVNVRSTVVEGYKNQHYPIEQIIDSASYNNKFSIYKIIALLENIHCIEQFEDIVNSTKNDITFTFKRVNDAIDGNIIYNPGLFSENTIQCMWSSYTSILKQVLKNIDLTINKIELISEAEKQKVLFEFNNTYKNYPDKKTISELFEAQVELTPDNIAVEFEENKLTYKQLNEKSNRLARLLLHHGVKVGDIIAIMVEYSLEMVIGIIAVLKAGAAYLPIDPKYPAERINYMLEDSQARTLLTQKNLICEDLDSAIIRSHLNLNIIDLTDETSFADRGASNLSINNSSDDLSYVIYTSGSTGLPKGVMIEHKSLVNFIDWRIKEYKFNSDDKILQLISISFDGFGTNLYASLLSGAKLILPGASHWGDFKYISEMIRSKKITGMSVVPVMYKAILDNSKENDLETLRIVVLAGDKSNSELIEKSYKEAGHITLVNEYGPTENCITTTALIGMSLENIDSIGRPISNNRVFIINKDNNLMPIGVGGELCVSGEGLARGYLNKLELTVEKFVQNPFSPDEKMYRTGDFAKWLPDGNIQFIGRVDYQVKIRGYRVELGEVEKTILKTKLVKEVIVVDKDDISGNKYLCAYVVASENMIISELGDAIVKELPNHMIPSRFVKLEKLPLTPNGKVNRKALPDPDQFIDAEIEYVKPKNSIEIEIVDIWSSVLKAERDRIGVNNNFFQIGGNSLLLMQVHNLIEKRYPGAVTIPDLFSYHTVSKLAEFIKTKSNKITNEWQGNSVKLPAEYFNHGSTGRKTSSLNFEIPSIRYDKISKNENISIENILISAYAYLLAKIADVGEVNFQAMMNEKNVICNIVLDLKRLKDFSQLFSMVSQKVNSGEGHVLSISNLTKTKVSKDEQCILPLFYIKSALTENNNLSEFFDLIFELSIYKDKAFFVCEYNSSLLKDDKVEDIVQMYLKIIELIASKCENSCGR